MNRWLVGSALLLASASMASAASLKLSYIKTPSGSLFQYQMTLAVDTSVSGFSAGMGWDWLIFGDVPNNGTSPIHDFVVTSGFPVGPWTSLTSSGGGHNGPTFNPVVNAYWYPTSSSDTLHWTGTSAYNAPDNTLTFSELVLTGGATGDSFKIMTTGGVPEPASLLVLGGLVPMFLRKRRNR